MRVPPKYKTYEYENYEDVGNCNIQKKQIHLQIQESGKIRMKKPEKLLDYDEYCSQK